MAQKPRFYLGFDQILDNREYFTEYGYHQTMFGARLNTGAFFSFDTIHQIRAGINYMYEYGGEFLGVKPQIDLYYSYCTERIDLFVGSFSRRERMDYPLMLLTDSLNYYRPNMEGASVRYTWGWGTVHGWVDWTGRETEETRESILAGIDATLKTGVFYLKAISTRYHLARTTAANDNNRLRDDGALVALLGMDLSERTWFHLLDISTGMASTYLRARPGDFVWNQGWLTQLDTRKGIFGLKASWYMGDPSPLRYGDRLYSHGDYGRFDFYIDPFHNPRISSKIGWNLHWLPGDGLYHSQQLLISISL
jgi:hypothetical protein